MGKLKILICVTAVLIANILFSSLVYGINKTGPVYITSIPGQNAVNVKIESSILIKFSKPIKKSANFLKISLKFNRDRAVKYSAYIKSNTLYMKAISKMAYSTTYTVTIPINAVMDSTGVNKKVISIKFKTLAIGAQNIQKQSGKKDSTSVIPVNGQTDSGKDAVKTTPSGVSTNPDSKNKILNIHAFYSGNTKYDNSTESYLKALNTVSFAWLDLKNENGNAILDGNDKTTDFHIPEDYYKPLLVCSENNIPAQITIFSDGETAKSIISDNTLREDLIKKIIENLSIKLLDDKTFDFSGVVIDFEGFRNNDTSEYFNNFLSELKSKLAALNKKLYVVVNVRSYWPGYDYKEILKYADKVILMAHDYEPSTDLSKGDILKYINYNSNDPIFTLAPINKVRAALEDLISSINSKSDMSKIWLQINFGISQWQFNAANADAWNSLDNSVTGKRVNPTYNMLQNRLSNEDGLAVNMYPGYINELESPYLTYYNLQSKTYNFILYEDSRSVKAKIDLSKLEGIDGISLWRLGNVPNINSSLGEKYNMNVWNTILDNAK